MQQHGGHRLRSGRVSQPGRVYLVTTVTFRRRRLFGNFFIGRIVVRTMHHMHIRGDVDSLCFTVMPDHLHWLFALGERDDLSKVVSRIKTWTARRINEELGERGRVWQPGFHDHALRRDEDVQAVARYVLANPLRAGLVERIGDYALWDAVWLDDGQLL